MCPPDVQPGRIAELIAEVLSGRFSAGAAAIAESFHQAGGPARAADAILSTAWRGRP